MFCPACGTEASDQTKFCTRCGANLQQIKGALVKIDPVHAELSELKRLHIEGQKHEFERRMKKTPEEKRLEEVKAGVIVSSVGLGLLIFLWLLFNAIAQSEPDPDGEIIRALRFVGLIPFLVGIGILINGLFVSKRMVEERRRQEQEANQPQLFSETLDTAPVRRIPEAVQAPTSNFSVTESTTTKLRERSPAPAPYEK
jgi:hypothetical protein